MKPADLPLCKLAAARRLLNKHMATKTKNMPLRGFFGHIDIANNNLKEAKRHIECLESFAQSVREIFPNMPDDAILYEIKKLVSQ